MNEISESQLVKEAINGDVQAFRYLVERTQDMVYKVAFRFMRNQHDAEDATQEVYIRLWKNLRGFNHQSKLTTWLYRITANYCLDRLKSAQRKTQSSGLTIDLADRNSLPGEEMEHRERWDLLHEAASRLTPKQQAAFLLRDMEGLSVEETCKILDLSDGQLKSNLYHARKNMQQMITKELLQR